MKVPKIPDQKGYLGLAQLYQDHGDFEKFYAAYDPKLLSFLVDAMKVYGKKNLE